MLKNCLPLLPRSSAILPISKYRYPDGNSPLSKGTQSHGCDLRIVTPIPSAEQKHRLGSSPVSSPPKKDETSPKPSEKHTWHSGQSSPLFFTVLAPSSATGLLGDPRQVPGSHSPLMSTKDMDPITGRPLPAPVLPREESHLS